MPQPERMKRPRDLPDLQAVAVDLVKAWAVAAEGKPPAVRTRLAKATLELWAAAAEGPPGKGQE